MKYHGSIGTSFDLAFNLNNGIKKLKRRKKQNSEKIESKAMKDGYRNGERKKQTEDEKPDENSGINRKRNSYNTIDYASELSEQQHLPPLFRIQSPFFLIDFLLRRSILLAVGL